MLHNLRTIYFCWVIFSRYSNGLERFFLLKTYYIGSRPLLKKKKNEGKRASPPSPPSPSPQPDIAILPIIYKGYIVAAVDTSHRSIKSYLNNV